MQHIKRLLWLVLPAILVAVVWTQRYDIYDWWRLRDYQPPARIVALADSTTMTDYARRLFYVNHPQLNDAAQFNQNCITGEESIVLGCYVSGEGIFLYDVDDPRLKGVHEVTAAHEMLHVAYERLSGSDKNRVNHLLAETYRAVNDDRIRRTVDSYRTRDSSQVSNELHSILATEVGQLGDELEKYYQRYFTDRSKVVALSRQYESAFEERKNQVVAYDAELSSLRREIDELKSDLRQRERVLADERRRLDALLAARRYDEYNAAVPVFNQEVERYNVVVNRVRALIERYNRTVAKRNAIALEENELIEAIDSRPDTLSTEQR